MRLDKTEREFREALASALIAALGLEFAEEPREAMLGRIYTCRSGGSCCWNLYSGGRRLDRKEDLIEVAGRLGRPPRRLPGAPRGG